MTFLPEKRKTPPPQGRKKPPPARASVPQMKKYRANQNFHSSGVDGYVDLVKDEEVEEVESDNGGWTKIQRRDGTQGVVPTDYLSG